MHNKRKNAFSYTISQADAGLLGIDVKENAFIANFGLGSQANQATEIRISRPT
jgi:translation elongation factor EF-1alpha